MKRGQGAFEYILMLAGVIMVVILVILIIQSTVGQANNTIGGNLNTYGNITNVTTLISG